VDEDDGSGVVGEDALHDLAGIDGAAVDGALGDDFIGDELVLAIEEQHAEVLGTLGLHGGADVIHQRRPRGEDRTVEDGVLGKVEGGGADHRNIGRGLEANTVYAGELSDRGSANVRECSEAVEQRFGDRFDVSLRN